MKNLRIIASFFLFILFFVSCTEEQDFEQFDDLTITPTYETSIFLVEAQEAVINNIVDPSFLAENFDFDAFGEKFFADRVIDGTITYQLENTTSKDIEVLIEFLDEDDNVLDTEFFQMNQAPSAVLTREVAYGNTGKSLDILKNTSNVRLSARNLGDNNSTSDLPDPAIILRSAGKFTVRLE